ncbi:MAG: SpoIIE family protein phosphatase [Chloroflexales bacterium]|nr:SpoIIE family protein phosphatase [Chloroflexales bacterium]
MSRLVVRNESYLQSEGNPTRAKAGRSISARLRWSYLLSSTLPLLLIGGWLIFLNFQTQQRSVYSSQEALTTRIAGDISTYIQGIEAQLLSFSRNFITAAPDDQVMLSKGLRNTNPDIRQLQFFVAENADMERFPLADSELAPTLQTSIGPHDSLVRSALEFGRGGRSDIYRTDDEQTLFSIVLPVRNSEGAIVGALRAEISATRISQLLRTPSEGFTKVAYLINAQHDVMLTDGTPGWQPSPDFETLFDAETHFTQYLSSSRESVIAAYAVIQPSTWTVVTEQSARVAFDSVWRSVLLLAVLVSVVGMLALGWALLQAQQLLRPLHDLRAGAVALGEGHLDHRIEVIGNDEMSQLARTFNQMASHLQTSLSQIEDQNERLRQGLMLARDIQMGLLPTQPPWNYDTLTVYARSIPAYEVGGDFYTYIAQHGDQAAIAIGDISGKGVGAALLMALTSSMVESQARYTERPAELLSALNRLLAPRLLSNRMNAALLVAAFDLHSCTMTVANAGMIAPLLVRQVNTATLDMPATMTQENHRRLVTEFIDVSGLPVGSLPGAFYQDIVLKLEPEDLILFLSDGLVEAHNEAGELFGFQRLEALIAVAGHLDVQTLVDTILKQVQDFMGQAEQHDDITIVAVKPTALSRITSDSASQECDVPASVLSHL